MNLICAASSWMMPNKVATLLSMRAADGGARLLLRIGTDAGEEALTVLTARLETAPRLGPLDEEQLAFYRAESEISGAVLAAMRSLAAGGSSKQALQQKLRQKGVSAAAAEAAVAILAERGYLQEEDGAVREAERCVAKLWGDRRILMELRAKGYGEEAVAAAMRHIAGEDGVARCARLIARRRLFPASGEALPRTVAALTRYGYTRAEITNALKLAAKARFDG